MCTALLLGVLPVVELEPSYMSVKIDTNVLDLATRACQMPQLVNLHNLLASVCKALERAWTSVSRRGVDLATQELSQVSSELPDPRQQSLVGLERRRPSHH